MTANKIENIVIAALWLIVFLWPLMPMYYFMSVEGMPFHVEMLEYVYSYLAAFFILFAIHHYVIVPALYGKKHYRRYALTVVVLLTCFTLYLTKWSPDSRFRDQFAQHDKPRKEMRHGKGPHHKNTDHKAPQHKDINHKTPPFLTPTDMARLVIAALMLGASLGAYAIARSSENRRRLEELEQQNVKQELDYLKYQINPHFFMNTLNNIHALVDIDQERAKRSVVELSQLMRYVLYEGTGSFVPLAREVEFIGNYLSLMRLRYSNKVEIVSRMPETCGDVQIPPLLLVTFIENAFKHGISYQSQSFIHIKLEIDEKEHNVLFSCINSRHPQKDGQGGIGLENVRKRLSLIYGNDYEFTVNDNSESHYAVELKLKISKKTL